MVKGARWLLLKNRDSLRPGEDVQLDELLAANHDLFIVYVLRDALKDLWGCRHPGYAARAWHSWYRKALRSGIEPLVRFARRLRPYLPGIVAHCRWPLGTNLVEGINNKIKVIKRKWPTASATTPASSARSGPRSPELGDEPFFIADALRSSPRGSCEVGLGDHDTV